MKRRGFIQGLIGGALLVGEPVRRAYSFLQANPLALTRREQLQRYIDAEVAKALRPFVGRPSNGAFSLAAIQECMRVFEEVGPMCRQLGVVVGTDGKGGLGKLVDEQYSFRSVIKNPNGPGLLLLPR